jgi:hypothetical protein
MHLLQIDANDELSLAEFYGKQIPQYAILSHTWIANHEEVTFRDIMEGRGKAKAGYEKLRFIAKQATLDGLHYFWVDTCCIDKGSSAELQEAINSMFRWYQKSKICYVYLSDVSSDTSSSLTNTLSVSLHQSWRPAFLRSRWFTRGWTLQELLAPQSLQFFSREGTLLGDKMSLGFLSSRSQAFRLMYCRGITNTCCDMTLKSACRGQPNGRQHARKMQRTPSWGSSICTCLSSMEKDERKHSCVFTGNVKA